MIVEPENQNNQIDPVSMFRKAFCTINNFKEVYICRDSVDM